MARRRTSTWAATAVAALILALLSPLRAGAAPTWRLPAQFIVDGSLVKPQSAVSPSGDAVVVYTEFIGPGNGTVYASQRSPGGGWSIPVPLSDPALFSTGAVVVVDAAGNATAAWQTTKATPVVQAAFRPAGGTWGQATDLTLTGTTPFGIDLAADAAGTVTVAWSVYQTSVVQSASRTLGGSWSAPETRSVGAAGSVSVTAGPAGSATIAYVRTDAGGSQVVATSRVAGGPWAPPEPVSEAGSITDPPDAAMDAQGRTLVVWPRNEGPGTITVIEASDSAPGGAWSQPVELSDPTHDAYRSTAAVNAAGDAVVGWHHHDGDNYRLQVRTRMVGAPWDAVATLSAPGQYAVPADVAIDPSGAATAAWSRENGLELGGSAIGVVQSAWRPRGGAWASSPDLTPATSNSDAGAIAVDAAGDVVIPLIEDGTSSSLIEVVPLDVAGPAITAFTAPHQGVPGKRLAFTAAAADNWSSVASYQWRFGDGKSGTGAAPQHEYAKPGTYDVRLTVTDSVGNSSVRTSTVKIGKKPAIKVLSLSEGMIRKGQRTTLTVRLNTKATLKLVFKGKTHDVRAVLKRQLPKGTSKITLSTKVGGKTLVPDTYVISAVAKNSFATSKKKTVTLKVVR